MESSNTLQNLMLLGFGLFDCHNCIVFTFFVRFNRFHNVTVSVATETIVIGRVICDG